MSDVYIQRLRSVQMEFNSAREAIRYVQINWQKHDIYADLARFTPANFDEAARHVKMTYFVRLYAEFEGILKDHLTANRPAVTISDKPKVDRLISLVLKVEAIRLDPFLRRKMEQVRDYRNSIAHHAFTSTAAIPFVDALSILNTFLAKLPVPRT